MLTTYLGNKVPLAVQIAQHASSILQSQLASWLTPKKIPDTTLIYMRSVVKEAASFPGVGSSLNTYMDHASYHIMIGKP